MNKQIEELFNKVEWQDGIINRQIIKINDLQEKTDRAIEYIKNKTTNERYGNLNGDEWYKKELHLNREELKDLLEILGDKE